MNYFENFAKYCRPQLNALLNQLEHSKPVSTSIIWHLLIELLSSVKVTVLRTQPITPPPKFVDLLDNCGQELNLLSTISTFAGWLLKVQDHFGRNLALKVLSNERTDSMHAYLTAAIRYVNSHITQYDKKTIVIAVLQYLVKKEMDLAWEAHSLSAHHKISRDIPGVVVPAPLPEWSTDRVLAMEWIEGINVESWKDLATDYRTEVAQRLLSFHRKAISTTGLLRYDTHLSNLKFMPNGDLTIVDYGSTIDLHKKLLEALPLDTNLESQSLAQVACSWLENFYNSVQIGITRTTIG